MVVWVVKFSEVVKLVDVLAWPVVVLLLAAAALSDKGRRLLRPALRRIRSISGGGFALELTEETARATKADIEGAVREYRPVLDDELDRLAYQHDIRGRLRAALRDHVGDFPEGSEYRATVHVRDPLFAEMLYQLVATTRRAAARAGGSPRGSASSAASGACRSRATRPRCRPTSSGSSPSGA